MSQELIYKDEGWGLEGRHKVVGKSSVPTKNSQMLSIGVVSASHNYVCDLNFRKQLGYYILYRETATVLFNGLKL